MLIKQNETMKWSDYKIAKIIIALFISSYNLKQIYVAFNATTTYAKEMISPS